MLCSHIQRPFEICRKLAGLAWAAESSTAVVPKNNRTFVKNKWIDLNAIDPVVLYSVAH